MVDKKILIKALNEFPSEEKCKIKDLEIFYKKLGVVADMNVNNKDFHFKVYNNMYPFQVNENVWKQNLCKQFSRIRIKNFVKKCVLNKGLILNSPNFKTIYSDIDYLWRTARITNTNKLDLGKLFHILYITPFNLYNNMFFVQAENMEFLENEFLNIIKDLTNIGAIIYYHSITDFIVYRQVRMCEDYLSSKDYLYDTTEVDENFRGLPDMTNGKLFKDFDIEQHKKASLDNLTTDILGNQKVDYNNKTISQNNLTFEQYKEGCVLILNFLTIGDKEADELKHCNTPSNKNLLNFCEKYNFNGMVQFTEHIENTFGKNRKLWDESARTFFSSEYATNYFIAMLNKIRKIEAKEKVKEIVKGIKDCHDNHEY